MTLNMHHRNPFKRLKGFAVLLFYLTSKNIIFLKFKFSKMIIIYESCVFFYLTSFLGSPLLQI